LKGNTQVKDKHFLNYFTNKGDGTGTTDTVLYFALETSRVTSLKAYTGNCTVCDKVPGLAGYPNRLSVSTRSPVMSAGTLA